MSDWRDDPDDPGNRLMLHPKCPECGEPAFQPAYLGETKSADKWECNWCGHEFEERGHPLALDQPLGSHEEDGED